MNLFEVIQPLKIIHPIGGERIIAALFPAPKGLYFFDIGWADPLNATHPIHFVRGKIQGEGPWIVKDKKIGDSTIEVIQDNDPSMAQALAWKEYIRGTISEKKIVEILFNSGLLTDEDKEFILKWEQNK